MLFFCVRKQAYSKKQYEDYPIEQIWHELRKRGFRNEVFSTLEKVVDRLCETIIHLSNDTVMSVTQRDWIKNIFI